MGTHMASTSAAKNGFVGKRPKLADVAERAGVSIATVSNVLNERESFIVSAETRQRVFEVAAELNYRPNHFARMLRTQQSKTLGLTITGFHNDYMTSLTSEIYDSASRRGYHVLIDMVGSDEEGDSAINHLISRNVDGIIVFWPFRRVNITQDPSMPPLLAIDTPIEPAEGVRLDRIEIDREQGLFAATNHMLTRGRRHVAISVPHPYTTASKAKLSGWRAAYEKAGLPCPPESWVVRYASSTAWDALTFGLEMARLARDKVPGLDGIICPAAAAVGLMLKLDQDGYRVPEDVAVVGLHDSLTAPIGRVDLASAVFPVRQIAETAVSRILNWINGSGDSGNGDERDTTTVLPMQFTPAASCGL